MNNKWKWALGLILATMVIIITPFASGFFVSYGMTRNSEGWVMPMMYGGQGMMAYGMMFLMWLILIASLILIGLGIVWLVKEISSKKHS